MNQSEQLGRLKRLETYTCGKCSRMFLFDDNDYLGVSLISLRLKEPKHHSLFRCKDCGLYEPV